MAIRTDTEFEVPITAKDEASATIRKTGDEADKATKKVERFGLSLISMNQALELARKFGAGLKASTDAFAKFETALVGVGKTTDITGEALQVLGRNLLDMCIHTDFLTAGPAQHFIHRHIVVLAFDIP